MSRPLLAHGIDITQWLEADAMTPDAERILRDRSIGRQLESTEASTGYRRVLAWWEVISKSHAPATSTGHRVASLSSLANGILALLGTVFGAAIAGVAFGYQGDFPVNLFALLGVLVGVPLIMLLLSLLLMSGRGLVPGSMLDSVAILSPGRWVGAFLERHVGLGLFESVAGK